MQVIAITGGIGAGKTIAARHLASHGAIVLDVDAIAKSLSAAPGPIADRIVAAFGPQVAGPEGGIDPAALSKVAFAAPEAARKLDGIVHPAVLRELVIGLRELDLMAQPPRVVILDIPLLVEAPAIAEIVDTTLVIEAPEDARVARCVQRGMEEEDVRARMAVQSTPGERADIADRVIVNDGDPERFERQLDEFWEREVGLTA